MGETVTRRAVAVARFALAVAAAGFAAGCHLPPLADGEFVIVDPARLEADAERPPDFARAAAPDDIPPPDLAPRSATKPEATWVAATNPPTPAAPPSVELERSAPPPENKPAPPRLATPPVAPPTPPLARLELAPAPRAVAKLGPTIQAVIARGQPPTAAAPLAVPDLDRPLPNPIPVPAPRKPAPPAAAAAPVAVPAPVPVRDSPLPSPIPTPAPRKAVTPPGKDGVLMVGGIPVTLPPEDLKPLPKVPPRSLPPAPAPASSKFTNPAEPPLDPARAAGILFAKAPQEPTTTEPPRTLPQAAAPPAAIPIPTPPASDSPLPEIEFPRRDSLPPAFPPPSRVTVGGQPVPYESLSELVGGGLGGFRSPGCATCGGGIGDGCPPGRPCTPGATQCEPFPNKTLAGRVLGGLYECLCCPDPCYQPRWEPIANAGFYTPGARPVAQQTFRWDYMHRVLLPDRGEYFWARADGNGKGPAPNAPAKGTPYLNAHDITLLTEVGTGSFALVTAIPYRSVNPQPFAESGAGFGDLMIGAKSLLFDSELLLFTMQFNTYVPSGNFRKGLGTGHTALEPTFIAGLRAGPKTYLQAMVAEWVPIGGDQDYQGAMIHYHFSINHELWRPVKGFQVIGTMETVGYTFQDGAYTNADVGTWPKLSGQSFLSMGGGLRLFYCDKFDAGLGGLVGVTGQEFAKHQLRLEFRYRY